MITGPSKYLYNTMCHCTCYTYAWSSIERTHFAHVFFVFNMEWYVFSLQKCSKLQQFEQKLQDKASNSFSKTGRWEGLRTRLLSKAEMHPAQSVALDNMVIMVNFCLFAERPHCRFIHAVRHVWVILKPETISL